MLSSVLRSDKAVQVNIEIMRAFVKFRQLFAAPGDFVTQLHKLTEMVKQHDDQIKEIVDVLRKMLEPPPAPTKWPIGFHTITTAPEAKS